MKSKDIIDAARDGNLARVKALIASGASVNSIDRKRRTPLHRACQKGHLEMVQYLKEQGADMNARDNDGKSPLHEACSKGHLEIVQYLVEQGADTNFRDNDGDTPLHMACTNGHLAVVQYLKEQGADINAKNNDGETPLRGACEEQHIAVVRYLKEQGADVNSKDNDGETPLLWACECGHLAVVQYLVEQGRADTNAKDNDGVTPLHGACTKGHLTVVQYLQEQGADMNAQDNDGRTPLYWASRYRHLAVVQYLVEEGRADVNARDKDGWTPLHRACKKGHLAVVQYLVEQGADVNAKDKSGRTALDVSRDDRIKALLGVATALPACADIPPEIRPPDSMPVAVAAPESALADTAPQQAPVAFRANSNRIVSAGRTEDGQLRGMLFGMFPADLPLLTLLDSLTPIMVSQPDIARQVQLAERKAVQLAAQYGTLSSHERAAIVLYTMEAIPRETSVYFMMNAALRKVDREAVRPWRDYIWLLLHALRKLPAIAMDTHVYRGMKVSISDLGDAYVEGSEFQWAGFSSTSLRVNVMQSEDFLGRSGPRVLFNLKLTEPVGRDISDFSLYREAEILLPPNMMFKVTGVLDAGNDLYILQCEQRESLDMLLDFRI